MFFVLFGLWLMMNGQWTGEIAAVGVVICGLIYLFICKFMDYSPRREWEVVRRMPRLVAYGVYLMVEVFKSSWAVMKLIWSPKLEPEPEVLTFRTKLKTGWGKTLLGNSITLTPGTITVDIDGDHVMVHAVDVSFVEGGMENSEMEKRIAHVEGGKKK